MNPSRQTAADADTPARVEENWDLSASQRDVCYVFRVARVGYRNYGLVVACVEGMLVECRTDADVEINSMYDRKRREEKG